MRRFRESAKNGLWPKLRPESQRMRHTPTPAEKRLWGHLRNNQLGFRFRRQHPLDRFIVDFVCLPAFLVVEVDGPIHQTQSVRDGEREKTLAGLGFRLLRFTNEEVLNNTQAVLDAIRQAFPQPHPFSLPTGGRG